MSLKIIGGEAKGLNLASPSSHKTRPTSVLLKRKLFDSMQDLSSACFVDLCAGTGSVGLEALSRGVGKLYFVDTEVKVLKENLQRFKQRFEILVEVKLIKSSVITWLRNQLSMLERETFELVLFFDPPYDDLKLYRQFFEQINSMQRSASVIVEGCSQKTMPIEQFQKEFGMADKILTQGTSYFAIYKS